MPAAGQTTVDFNNSFFDEMLNSAGVRALTRGAAEKALNIARANAPVDTGAYRDGLQVGPCSMRTAPPTGWSAPTRRQCSSNHRPATSSRH